MSAITQYMSSEGSVPHALSPGGVENTNTTLSLWAASEWHDPGAVNYAKTRMADFLMKLQRVDGSWAVDHPYTWWASTAPLVSLNLGSLTKLKQTLSTSPAVQIPQLTPVTISGLPSGDMRFAAAPDGSLYVAHLTAHQIWLINPLGVATLLVPSINVRSVYVMADGRLLIGAASGIFIRESSGVLTLLSSQNTLDVKPNGAGKYWVSPQGGGAAYLMDSSGVMQPVFTSALLSNSVGAVVPLSDGSYLTHSSSGQRVIRFNDQGQLLDLPVPVTNGSPNGLTPYGDGVMAATDVGLFFYNKDWVAQRFAFERVVDSIQMPDGRLLVNYRNGVYQLQRQPLDTPAFATRIDAAVSAATGWLLAGSGINGNSNIEVAFRLMGLGSAQAYYKGTARAAEFAPFIQSVGATLRSRQQPDGGWLPTTQSSGPSDSMVTAMVGIALDVLNPSPNSPEVRKAVQLLLGRQAADGSWAPAGNAAPLIPSTWVEIWLPTVLDRLGGIDTNLNLSFPPGVVMANPDIPPSSSSTAPDGSSNFTWALTGVTSEGQTVNFDLTLANMQEAEVRQAAQLANLQFANSFTGGTVVAPISIPSIVADPGLTLSVVTNKPIYSEVDQATFTATVANRSTTVRNPQVRFTVFDTSDTVVERLPLGNAISVAIGQSNTDTAYWPTTVLAGTYLVKAELLNAAGEAYASASANFAVQASQNQVATAHISTDRITYSTTATVQISSRVGNASSNTLLNQLNAVTSVANSSGQVVFSQSQSLAQLSAQAQRSFSYNLAGATLSPGLYQTQLVLYDSQGLALARSSSTLTVVADSQNTGLNGQLQAQPASLPPGQTTTLDLTLRHLGGNAAAIHNSTVRVRIIDPTNGTVIATMSQAGVDLAVGGMLNLSWPWVAIGNPGQNYPAVASIEMAGQEIPLAQTTIQLIAETLVIPVATAHISTDRITYSTTDTVQISSRVGNASSSTLLNQLSAVTSVTNSSGQVVFSQSQSLAQLSALEQRSFSYNLAGATLSPGLYQTQLVLYDSQGLALARSSSTLTVVADSQNTGLNGQLQAQPASLPPGQTTTLDLTLRHLGGNAAAIHNSTVRVRIIDPTNGTVIATMSQAGVDLAVGGMLNLSWPWVAIGNPGQTYLATASIELAGQEIALAQTTIQLIAETPVITAVPLFGHGLHAWLVQALLALLLMAVASLTRQKRRV